MLTTLLFLTTAQATDPIWIPDSSEVQIADNIELPSLADLKLEGPALGCASIVTLNADGSQEMALATRRCPRKLYDALQELVPSMTFDWGEEGARKDIAVRVEPAWPTTLEEPIKMRLTMNLPGAFEPPAKFPGAVKKMVAEEQHCTVNLRIFRSGNADVLEYTDCPAKLQKHAARGIGAWTWKVPKEVPRRPLMTSVRLDWYAAIEMEGESRSGVLVSGAQPTLHSLGKGATLKEGKLVEATEEATKPTSGTHPAAAWPDAAASGLPDAPTCQVHVETDTKGVPTSATALACDTALGEVAAERAMDMRWLPRSFQGELVGSEAMVGIKFLKPDGTKKAEEEAKEEAEEAAKAEAAEEEANDEESEEEESEEDETSGDSE